MPTTPTSAQAFGEGFDDEGADGVAEGDVADDAVAEEGRVSGEGAVDELVGDDEVGGLVLFLQATDGGDGEDGLVQPSGFERVDVGAEVELGGEDAVAAAVAGEEGDLPALEGAEDERVGGGAERGFDGELADVGEAGHGVEAAASDDADFCVRGFWQGVGARWGGFPARHLRGEMWGTRFSGVRCRV